MRVSTFAVADLLFGVDVDRVAEVVGDQPVVPVPLSHPSVAGLMNLRGRILTVFDARQRLGLHSQRAAEHGAHVILRHGAEGVSLLVDRAHDVVTLPDEQQEDLPETISPWIRTLTTSVHQLEDRLLLVIDSDALMDVSVNPRMDA